MPGGNARRVAAIDCGTNSLRLLVADVDPDAGRLTDLHRSMEIVRLGQGVDATGRLAPEALDRTFAVLRQYSETIEEFGAEAVRMVATSATRDATNAAEFAEGVSRILRITPEVVTGSEEARLSFAGATAELGPAPGGRLEPPVLVVDIGGGSTEFVIGAPGAAPGAGLAAMSMNVGSVRLTERHLHDDPPTAAQIQAATADVGAALEAVAAAMPVSRARALVGLAGSVTTVAGVALGLTSYDSQRIHHARLSAAQIHEVTENLLHIGHAERAAITVIHPGRVDVIGAGALILDQIMRRFGFAEVVVSEHDILDGIAWSMVPAPAGRPAES
jgi:exopolyphosphatase/guanosine-5'-triphosphate,3'-diphosphate pyrophosphatase